MMSSLFLRCGFVCGVCVVLISSLSFLLLVPQEARDCGISLVSSLIFVQFLKIFPKF